MQIPVLRVMLKREVMMKKIIVVLMVVLVSGKAFAADSRKSAIEELLKTAVSPVDTILGKATELEKIVVTPSRADEKIVSSSCSISVVDSEDFDRKKIDTVKESLSQEVGLDIVQAGSFQGQTSLFTRGGNSNQTLILVDGVKVYDPISPNGAYNLANLTTDNVGNIEILRGPQSALYGSDAMSGVVSIMSKKADKAYMNADFEGGSFYTFDEHFEMGAVAKSLSYSIAASQLNTKGISQAQAKKNNQERDPYDRTSVAGRIDYDIYGKANVGGTFRYLRSHYALDQGADADDDNAFVTSTDNFFTLFANYKMWEWWDHDVTMGWFETDRLTYDEDSPGIDFNRRKDFGKSFNLDYHSTIDIVSMDKVVAGYNFNQELGDYYSQNDWSGAMGVTDMPKVFSSEGDFYVENRFNYQDRLTSTQGMRVGHHSRAGTFETYRIDGSYLFATGTKVRGLWATGFRAPALYQLYAPADPWFGGGNPALKPERSRSYEFGVDQYLLQEKVIACMTYFHTLYTNLIDSPYNPSTWTSGAYVNIGKAQAHGIELSVKVKPSDRVRIETGFTFMTTKDFQNDQEMPRRPAQKFYVESFFQVTDRLDIDIQVNYNGPRSDNLNTFSNTYKVKGYTVVNAVVNYDITKNYSVFARVENLFNKYYEEVRGYTMSPFGMYGGVKAKF